MRYVFIAALLTGYALAQGCSAPAYSCVTTSTANPGTITPLFTGTTGVNQTAYDTSYNAAGIDCYTRATDSTTWGGKSTDNNTFSGGANDIMWSKLNTYVGVEQGGATSILHLNTSGNCGSVINTGNLTGAGGIHVAGPFGFSKVTDNLFHVMTNFTQWFQYTITSDTTTTNIMNVDVASGTACPGLPSGFSNYTHGSILGIAQNDDSIGVTLSTAGGQGTGVWGVVYSKTKGCAVINFGAFNGVTNPLGGKYWAFCTVSCTPSTAPTGSLASSNACTGATDCSCWGGGDHDSQMSGDGNSLIITLSGVWTQGACAGLNYATMFSVWLAGTAQTQFVSSNTTVGPGGLNCGGHDSVGYSSMLCSLAPGVETIRNLSNTIPATTFNTFPSLGEGAHGHWPHPTTADTFPWIQTSYDLHVSQGTGCAGGSNFCPINLGNALYAEYPAAVNQPRTIFGHTFSCNTTNAIYAQCGGVGDTLFACANAITSVSQDGNWAMLASGMLKSLGTDSLGNPRCDTFIVRLGSLTGLTQWNINGNFSITGNFVFQ